jgi:hypothetical protein
MKDDFYNHPCSSCLAPPSGMTNSRLPPPRPTERHFISVPQLTLESVPSSIYLAKSMGVELISEKEWCYMHEIIVKKKR